MLLWRNESKGKKGINSFSSLLQTWAVSPLFHTKFHLFHEVFSLPQTYSFSLPQTVSSLPQTNSFLSSTDIQLLLSSTDKHFHLFHKRFVSHCSCWIQSENVHSSLSSLSFLSWSCFHPPAHRVLLSSLLQSVLFILMSRISKVRRGMSSLFSLCESHFSLQPTSSGLSRAVFHFCIAIRVLFMKGFYHGLTNRRRCLHFCCVWKNASFLCRIFGWIVNGKWLCDFAFSVYECYGVI